jgi:hypothetical protein
MIVTPGGLRVQIVQILSTVINNTLTKLFDLWSLNYYRDSRSKQEKKYYSIKTLVEDIIENSQVD